MAPDKHNQHNQLVFVLLHSRLNYSNAKYYLGLIYDRDGNKQAAIKEFEEILQLNPGNADVKRILDNLKSGKAAL